MTGTFAENGSLNELPWASVFDPAANARALSAVQAEGFRAASRIVDRFVRVARSEDGIAEQVAGRPDLEQLTRAWWSVAGQFLLGASPQGREVELDLASPGEGGVVLETTLPGRAETVVWLHNRTANDFGRITLRCSDLLSHDGSVIGSAEVVLEPAVVEMPARCSRGIEVAVDVAAGARPAVYRGNLLVDNDDGLWLPVALTVRAPAT